MKYYLCPEPGSIPGIPVVFAGCRVDVADDGTYTTTPLAQHHAFVPGPETPAEDAESDQAEKPAIEKSEPEHVAEAK